MKPQVQKKIGITFDEYEGLTNAEVYRRSFHELLMLPLPGSPGKYLGNSQREEFLPFLERAVSRVSALRPARVLDVGAGSGEVVALALHKLPKAEISFEEPNTHLIKQYESEVRKFKNLAVGRSHQGTVQSLYQELGGSHWFNDLPSQDLVLAIHMIYHLTPFASGSEIDPEGDLCKMISALYAKLSPQGTIVLVYADQTKSFGGKMAQHYFATHSPEIAHNLNRIWTARNRLLKEARIAEFIQAQYPENRCEVTSSESESKFFARSLKDMAVIGVAGELGTSDDELFKVDKLYSCFDYLSRFGAEVGLATETGDGPRNGMIRVNQPQIICEIKKVS